MHAHAHRRSALDADLNVELVVRVGLKYSKQSRETAGSLVAGFQSCIRSRRCVNFPPNDIRGSTCVHGLGGIRLTMDALLPDVGSRIASAESEGVPNVFIICAITTEGSIACSGSVLTRGLPLRASMRTMPRDQTSAFMCSMITDSGDRNSSGAEYGDELGESSASQPVSWAASEIGS
jgi:hypothetical protein